MASLLNVVNQQQTPIDEEKLELLCSQKNVWDHFGLEREVFGAFSSETAADGSKILLQTNAETF